MSETITGANLGFEEDRDVYISGNDRLKEFYLKTTQTRTRQEKETIISVA